MVVVSEAENGGGEGPESPGPSAVSEPPEEGPVFAECDPTGRYGRFDQVLGRGAFKVRQRAGGGPGGSCRGVVVGVGAAGPQGLQLEGAVLENHLCGGGCSGLGGARWRRAAPCRAPAAELTRLVASTLAGCLQGV